MLAPDLKAHLIHRPGIVSFAVTSESKDVTITIPASSNVNKHLPRLQAEVLAMVRHFNAGYLSPGHSPAPLK